MIKALKVGICGLGTVGSALAELCARSGYETTVLAKSSDHIARGMTVIQSSFHKDLVRKRITPLQHRELLSRIKPTNDINNVQSCDIVFESVHEELLLKQSVLASLDAVCEPKTIFATTTSSLSITKLASATHRPTRVIGMHFFNPVQTMRLVEVARSKETSDQVVEAAEQFGRALGKTPIVVQDNPGFLANCLLFPYLLDAVRMLESGVAAKEDIDAVMRLGCNMPMGPLKLIDLIGIDTTLTICENLFLTYKNDRFRTPTLLQEMVQSHKLGKKVGQGFYVYQ